MALPTHQGPMEPITFEEVSVLDANSEYRGVPSKVLMENAGKGVAEHLLDTGAAGRRILIICGSGNNGGDGFVAAQYLAKEAEVDVVLLRSRDHIRTEISRANLRQAEEVGIPITVADEEDITPLVDEAHVIVDAMLGVGGSGPPRGIYAEVIAMVNSSGKRVVSVDIPSGWGTELAVRPESTVTFHAPKVGMGAECGQTVIKPIGIPEEAEGYAGPGELLFIPSVAPDAHKGQRGNVLVIGGGPYTGAPALAALAAHRTAIDLVYVAVPGAIANVVRGYSMDLIVRPVGRSETEVLSPLHLRDVLTSGERADAVVLGPGLGDEPGSVELAGQVFRQLAEASIPAVVDADALKAFKGARDVPAHPRAVLTPHAGEFEVISGRQLPKEIEERSEAVRELAARLGCTVLAKGPVDVVSDGRRVKLNDTGNAAMATGGTGDVLSGVVGALLAKGMDAFDAARAAVFVVGTAGDDALAERGHSLLASDVLDKVPSVFARYLEWWTRR